MGTPTVNMTKPKTPRCSRVSVRRQRSPQLVQTPPTDLPQIDLLPMHESAKLAVLSILRMAHHDQEGTIFIHDPICRTFGLQISARDILQARRPEILVRTLIQDHGCAWFYWSHVAES